MFLSFNGDITMQKISDVRATIRIIWTARYGVKPSQADINLVIARILRGSVKGSYITDDMIRFAV